MRHTLFVCDSCRQDSAPPCGPAFAKDLAERIARDPQLAQVEVRTTTCLNMCDEPMAVALRAPEKMAYLFAGLRPDADIEDTLALLRLYVEAADGEITDARPAGRLRFCLKGRIPPLR